MKVNNYCYFSTADFALHFIAASVLNHFFCNKIKTTPYSIK